MKKLVLLFTLGATLLAGAEEPITNATDVTNLATVRAQSVQNRRVDITGIVEARVSNGFILRDATGGVRFRPETNLAADDWTEGDKLRISGHIQTSRLGEIVVIAESAVKIGHAAPSQPLPVSAKDIADGRTTFRRVRLSGIVTSAFRDEIDSDWNWLYLTADGRSTVIAFPNRNMDQATLNGLIDASVEVTGVSLPAFCGYRSFPGAYVEFPSLDRLRILEPPIDNPFDAPEYQGFSRLPESRSPATLHRQRIFGRVLATWRGDRLLLVTPERHRVLARIRRGTPLPAVGATITLVGFIRRSAFYTFLTDGLFQSETRSDFAPEPQEMLRLDEAFIGEHGYSAFAFGRPLRLVGTVQSITSAKTIFGRLLVESDRHLIPVEFGGGDPPEIGSLVEVSGICITTADTDDWDIGFGRLHGFYIVPRSPDDVRIVKSAPWWTPIRFVAVIGTLLAALFSILLWNMLLRRLAERQGRELYKSQIAGVTSMLRVDERTRLAVELHDSLSQQLTAISYEIAAAESVRATDPETSAGHLAVAGLMLQSCRTELRRCLWDLRSEALDESDFSEAIRRTVMPVIDTAELSVRFSVPRSRIGDLTAHAVLCIIRELAANAVRHGLAKHVRVAGERYENGIRFSVRDDGVGFDPATAPGSVNGHFGLDGIRDRVNRLGGTLEITSQPNTGTRAVVTLQPPTDNYHNNADENDSHTARR